MKIAVTGKYGQVVRSLLTLADDKTEIIALGRPELNLAFPNTINAILSVTNPDVIVSAAAYTAVDKAEDELDLAYAVNAIGAGAVAEAAAQLKIPIIHISTDYVFDGTKPGRYTELDEPNPQSVYGKSKLAGERIVATKNKRHIILRTAWVYSPYGNNFLKTMLRLGNERSEINVVSDQCGNPTSAINIATTIISICKEITKENYQGWGIYHLVDDSETTWYHWAKYIFLCSRQPIIVNPINGSDYPSKAQRPNNSRLSTEKIKNTFQCRLPSWQNSTQLLIKKLNYTKS